MTDEAILIGLENTRLLGRSQFLTPKEAEALQLPGAIVLLDGGFDISSPFFLIIALMSLFLLCSKLLVYGIQS